MIIGKAESGNVLFLIIIAVALFAALSYAVTSSTRNNGGSTSAEQTKANAAAILQFGATLKSAVTRMRLINNCGESNFDFSNPIYKKTDGTPVIAANSNAPSNKTCHVFDPLGGNLTAVVPPYKALDPSAASSRKPGHGSIGVYQIKNDGTDGVSGSSTSNDMVFSQGSINRKTCIAINDLLGIVNPSGEPPVIDLTVAGSIGGYSNGAFSGSGIVDNAAVNGRAAFCRDATGGVYQFVQVLMER